MASIVPLTGHALWSLGQNGWNANRESIGKAWMQKCWPDIHPMVYSPFTPNVIEFPQKLIPQTTSFASSTAQLPTGSLNHVVE